VRRKERTRRSLAFPEGRVVGLVGVIVPPPRTHVCILAALCCAFLASASSADPALEAGLYAYQTWHPIGQAVSGLSGPVQFRVRLPFSTMPAPWAVFAVHTTDPENPWRVEGAGPVESFSPHEWIYYSPQFDTVPTLDGNWDAWCQVIYGEPPIGGGGDSVVPGDPEVESAGGSVATCSWNPPPYGWPDGFPCADNGQNDLYCGPTGFLAKNLTIDSVDLTGLTLLRMFAGGPAMPAPLDWACALADGIELADNPAGVSVHFHLVPLAASTGQQDDTSVGSAPGSISGSVDGGGTGLYYVDATADEYLTGDSARWLSPALTVTEVAPYGVGVTGARTGDVYSVITTADTRGPGPLLGSQYVALRPGDFVLLGLVGETPQASDCQTAEMAGPVDFRYAGDYSIAATYQDEAPGMHAGQHQWAPPAAGTVHVPAGEFFVDNAEDQLASSSAIAGYADAVTAEIAEGERQPDHTEFPAGFYSPRYPHEGGVIVGPTKEEFLLALDEDEILYHGGHCWGGELELRADPVQVLLTPADIRAFAAGQLGQGVFFMISGCYTYAYDNDTCICGALRARGAGAVFGYTGACNICADRVIAEKRLWDYLVLGWPATQDTTNLVEQELTYGGNWNAVSAGWADDPSTSPTVEDQHLVGTGYIVPAITY